MKSFLILILFVGMFFIIDGVYDQKIKLMEEEKKVEYRFIPRNYYQDQITGFDKVSTNFMGMFNKESPWYDRTIGDSSLAPSKLLKNV